MRNKRILGIIGVGPRGLNATEQFIEKLCNQRKNKGVHLFLFEQTGNFGYSKIYDIEQVATNWINISERIICLNKRPKLKWGDIEIPSFPSFHAWSDFKFELSKPDFYPPRAHLGKYLQLRFESLTKPLIEAGIVSLFEERIEDVSLQNNGKIKISSNLNTYGDVDEVLLAIGHQPTELSQQLIKWKKYFKGNDYVCLFEDPYPVSDILDSKKLNHSSHVAIRGFGLAMIDVIRGIANKFGHFSTVDEKTLECKFHYTQDISNLLIPFSLDGLPQVPKPLNAKIDNQYKISESQRSDFEKEVGDDTIQKNAIGTDFLINAIAPIAARTYLELPKNYLKNKFTIFDVLETTKAWLSDETFEHPLILSKKLSPYKKMQSYVGMATGTDNVSLDYCIGQVWRHCQPSIYEKLSFNQCNEEVFAEVINLDEKIKRYSYGPPVESIQQMLALISAGVMTLEFVINPEIKMSPKGWQLSCGNKTICADIMINSVLDAPQIKTVIAPLVRNLLSNNLIQVVHDDLGVLTNDAGYIIPKDENKNVPIALLGRLAKGTIIGVDAILECFGNRPKNWASVAAERHCDWLDNQITLTAQ